MAYIGGTLSMCICVCVWGGGACRHFFHPLSSTLIMQHTQYCHIFSNIPQYIHVCSELYGHWLDVA